MGSTYFVESFSAAEAVFRFGTALSILLTSAPMPMVRAMIVYSVWGGGNYGVGVGGCLSIPGGGGLCFLAGGQG